MEQRVLVSVSDGIATVTMNRPDKLNGLDYEMFVGLVDAARQIKRDRLVRVVILRGEGRGFCAGLDFKSWGQSRGRMMRS
ncbi:MAG: enoyl-CoA hydratase-related protein, partial [Pseudomonadota bacterium]|nr:enoyl-CoA hydratase-related protein [Pseudomonadota bacterium]